MPFFTSSEELYEVLKLLFSRIGENDPGAARAISRSRLLMRLRLTSPSAIVTFNGRQDPVDIVYGASTLRSDIELDMPADMLHQILLSELPLKKAVASGKMKVRGPFLKAFVFGDIFLSGQALYPQVLEGLDRNGNRKIS